jgi:hypothetical protein
MLEMRTLNGYEVVDARARREIEDLQEAIDKIEVPVMPDLTPYATEDYVDNAIGNIPEVDLSKHALKSEVPTKVSQLQNDSKYITREEVPNPDLSEYITNSALEAKDYATKKYVTDANTATEDRLAEYVNAAELRLTEQVPTKVSQLLNDKQYVTKAEVPESVDTTNLLTKTTVNDQYCWYVPSTNKHQVIQNDVALEKMDSALDVVVGGKTLSNNSIAMREGLQLRVPETPTKTNHAASKAYVDKQIASIPATDLTNYALKSSVPTKVSQLTNDKNYLTSIPDDYLTASEIAAKGYLTSIPSEYITETELNQKGYLTQHQSLAGYATETYVANKIAEAKLEGEGDSEPIDLSGYATKDDIKNFITEVPSEYVTESELNAKGYITDVSNLAPKSSIPTKVSQLTNDKNYISSIPDDYITESDLNAKGYITDISGKADVVHEHTQYMKSEDFNNWEQVHSDDIESRFAQKSYVDAAIADIDLSNISKEVVEIILPSSFTYITDAASIEALERLYAEEQLTVYLRYANSTGSRMSSDLVNEVILEDNDIRLTSLQHYGYASELAAVTYKLIRESASAWKVVSSTSAKYPKITAVSELENDTGFITADAITGLATKAELTTHENEVADYLEDVEARLTTKIPTKVSQLTNDKNYISSTTANSNYYPKASGQTNATDIAELKADVADLETAVNTAISGTKLYRHNISFSFSSENPGVRLAIISTDSTKYGFDELWYQIYHKYSGTAPIFYFSHKSTSSGIQLGYLYTVLEAKGSLSAGDHYLQLRGCEFSTTASNYSSLATTLTVSKSKSITDYVDAIN